MASVAAAIVAVNVVVQVPWYHFGKPTDVGAHVSVRVLSANLRLGHADVSSFIDLARASADVITLSEMTPDWLRGFYSAGARTELCWFPRSAPAVSVCGVGSRSKS